MDCEVGIAYYELGNPSVSQGVDSRSQQSSGVVRYVSLAHERASACRDPYERSSTRRNRRAQAQKMLPRMKKAAVAPMRAPP